MRFCKEHHLKKSRVFFSSNLPLTVSLQKEVNMIPTVPSSLPEINVDAVVKKIQEYTGGEEGVLLFEDLQETETLQLAQIQGANKIFDSLLYVLGTIGEYTGNQIHADGVSWERDKYQQILSGILHLSTVCNALAYGQIPLFICYEKMANRISKGDRDIRIYQNEGAWCHLDDTSYKIRIFLRTEPLVHGGEVTLPTRLTIRITTLEGESAELRIDYDNNDYTEGIVFDIVIGDDLLQKVDMSGVIELQSTKRSGHHFIASYTQEDIGISFSELMKAFDEKFKQTFYQQYCQKKVG